MARPHGQRLRDRVAEGAIVPGWSVYCDFGESHLEVVSTRGTGKAKGISRVHYKGEMCAEGASLNGTAKAVGDAELPLPTGSARAEAEERSRVAKDLRLRAAAISCGGPL